MHVSPTINPTVDLETTLGEKGQIEYRRLRRSLRMARGTFFLFPVESDFSYPRRDAMFERLATDLAADGLRLRVARLTQDHWDVLDSLGVQKDPVIETDVVVLIGLEETPGLVQEIGRKPSRPPALALLNNARESLRRCIPAPLIVWCSPFAYTALLEHAPDFFDHYAGLFQFWDTAPANINERSGSETLKRSDADNSNTRIRPVGSRAALAFYEEQVARYTEPTSERARALLGLAESLRSFPELESVARLQRALAAAQEALSLLSPDEEAYNWARAQLLQGIIYADLPNDNRTDNLRQAIACYEAALLVFTEKDSPKEWALTQNNLGIAYSDLPDGNRVQNQIQAIQCYQAALRILTETDFPQDWALTQNNLGTVYSELQAGNRADTLRQAIQCYHEALKVYTENDLPKEWALTQNNLGNTYREFPDGNYAANLRESIVCYEAALRVLNKNDFPQDWAITQYNLGGAYLVLPFGSRETNLKSSIECFQNALQVYTKDNAPQDWASVQDILGTAYCELPNGNRTGNLQQAIQYYYEALKVRNELNFPHDWAATQNNLGNAFLHLANRMRDANSQKAIDCYRATLRVYNETNLTENWAKSYRNLGIALNIAGDFVEARQSWLAAERGYRQVGLVEDAEKVRLWREALPVE